MIDAARTSWVPVPTHWRTFLTRGFNPAEVLARNLAKQQGRYQPQLIKKQYSRPQVGLNKAERSKNLRGSFGRLAKYTEACDGLCRTPGL